MAELRLQVSGVSPASSIPSQFFWLLDCGPEENDARTAAEIWQECWQVHHHGEAGRHIPPSLLWFWVPWWEKSREESRASRNGTGGWGHWSGAYWSHCGLCPPR
jgi:hypothetical protein